MEGVRPLSDRLCLEVPQKNLLWKLELSQDAWVKGAEDPLVQVAEVIVPPTDDRWLHLTTGSLHHDRVGHVFPSLFFNHLGRHHVELQLRSEFVIADVDRLDFSRLARALFLSMHRVSDPLKNHLTIILHYSDMIKTSNYHFNNIVKMHNALVCLL